MPLSPLDPYQQGLLSQARSLLPEPPPGPWRAGVNIHAGGIVAAGWDEDRIVLLSHSGYSMIHPSTGERLARDRDRDATWTALAQDRLSFTIPATSKKIPVFGIWGGDGCHVTADGWRVEVIYPWWPLPAVILGAPIGPGANGPLEGATLLDGVDGGGWICCGFSPSGSHLMIVESAGPLIVSR